MAEGVEARSAGDSRRLWIEGPAGRLESILRVHCPAAGAVVLAHPHPLHGGTLHHPVLFHADRELHRAGWTSLRFNFRGVGSSDGAHDQGRGEVADLGAAVSWIRGVAPRAPLVLVGYSFGSWCAIRHALDDPSIAGVVAIGLPVRIYSLEEGISRLGRPIAVVQGSEDEFGSLDEVRALLDLARPPGRLHEVPGASHLFPGKARQAAALVVRAAKGCLETAGSPGPAEGAAGAPGREKS